MDEVNNTENKIKLIDYILDYYLERRGLVPGTDEYNTYIVSKFDQLCDSTETQLEQLKKILEVKRKNE